MNENLPSAETSILNDPYEREVHLSLWDHNRKKTAQALFIIGGVLLAGNFIAYASANALSADYLPDLLLFPALFFGLGILARFQPLVAAIGGIVVLVAIAVLGFIAYGGVSLVSGWLFKAVAVYFIIRCVGHAREAQKAREQLRVLG